MKSAFNPHIASLIDHTVLRADATKDDILRICSEAKEYEFASVCINGSWVPLVASELSGTKVKVCTVVGFPLGAMSTKAKVAETEIAVREGAQEVDMVMNVGALKSGDRGAVANDISAVGSACRSHNAALKVILETALLTDDEKKIACELAKVACADFVKTSTGFGPSGATEHDVALIRAAVGPEMGVKASGGIRTLHDLQRMVAAGANRIGASASVAIIQAALA